MRYKDLPEQAKHILCASKWEGFKKHYPHPLSNKEWKKYQPIANEYLALRKSYKTPRVDSRPNLLQKSFFIHPTIGKMLHCVLIPLGSHEFKGKADFRKKNWRGAIPSYKTETLYHNMGQYSSNCKWNHWQYTRKITSFGIVLSGHLMAKIDTADGLKQINLAPWRGWKWVKDENGICLKLP
jgi:hypothetical protein